MFTFLLTKQGFCKLAFQHVLSCRYNRFRYVGEVVYISIPIICIYACMLAIGEG